MNIRKKVLYVITKGNFGGAQRYIFDLATHLPKDQFDPVVVFGEGSSLGEKLNSAGIRNIFIPNLKRDIGPLSDFLALISLIRILHKEHPDVVHLNSSKAGILGILAVSVIKLISKSYPLKTIFTGHGWATNEDRSFLVKMLFFKVYWWIIILSDKTIAVSRRTADQINWMPFLKKKITVMYNGVEVFPLIPQSEARKVLAPNLDRKIWIGTLSELHTVKGIDLLLKAFAVLAPQYVDVGLVIVGSGDEKEHLALLAEELSISDRVVFTGFIPDAKRYLNALDIFTLTSRSEAFPYALLEAGLANLPVVASWVGGIPEIITNEESGLLIDPEKTDILSHALDRLVTNTELRRDLGTRLGEEVRTEFNLETMMERYLRIIV